MSQKTPTIKGIFVNSHIKIVLQKKGKRGIKRLEALYGRPLQFRNFQNVPVREEVKIIEAALKVLSDHLIPESHLAFEAGRLHFRDFTTTPLAQIIFSVFRKRFKQLMLHSKNIAGHVFQGVRFFSQEMGPKSVKVIMENNDYPIDHFQGLFQEWMDFAGLKGTVVGSQTEPNRYEYTMNWK